MKPSLQPAASIAGTMSLEILLPIGVFINQPNVLRVVVDTTNGSYGLMPNRLDCVASLVPGILTYESKNCETVYVAVDEGVLVKMGAEVTVSVRRAIRGMDLTQLRDTVANEFLRIGEQERDVRNAVAKMDSGLIGQLAEFEHEG